MIILHMETQGTTGLIETISTNGIRILKALQLNSDLVKLDIAQCTQLLGAGIIYSSANDPENLYSRRRNSINMMSIK